MPITQKITSMTFAENTDTDWAFIMFIVDSANDADDMFPDGYGGFACWGANRSPNYLVMPVKTLDWPVNLEFRIGHEMGHIFWA